MKMKKKRMWGYHGCRFDFSGSVSVWLKHGAVLFYFSLQPVWNYLFLIFFFSGRSRSSVEGQSRTLLHCEMCVKFPLRLWATTLCWGRGIGAEQEKDTRIGWQGKAHECKEKGLVGGGRESRPNAKWELSESFWVTMIFPCRETSYWTICWGEKWGCLKIGPSLEDELKIETLGKMREMWKLMKWNDI